MNFWLKGIVRFFGQKVVGIFCVSMNSKKLNEVGTFQPKNLTVSQRKEMLSNEIMGQQYQFSSF